MSLVQVIQPARSASPSVVPIPTRDAPFLAAQASAAKQLPTVVVHVTTSARPVVRNFRSLPTTSRLPFTSISNAKNILPPKVITIKNTIKQSTMPSSTQEVSAMKTPEKRKRAQDSKNENDENSPLPPTKRPTLTPKPAAGALRLALSAPTRLHRALPTPTIATDDRRRPNSPKAQLPCKDEGYDSDDYHDNKENYDPELKVFVDPHSNLSLSDKQPKSKVLKSKAFGPMRHRAPLTDITRHYVN
ncbi:hypothetical protein BDF19DRAFT_421869 [Syncephalis fuscata]|nr:hypothetical protein BDF19DRAFT_421869 [Syncephalis fuscata]